MTPPPVTPNPETPEAPRDAALTYEQARDELSQVVERLESGSSGLTESMALWQRGKRLADTCQSFLDEARATVAASE